MYIAQEHMDVDLMNRAVGVIKKRYRCPAPLTMWPTIYSRSTWELVLMETGSAFMFCPFAFLLYKIIFDVDREDFHSMVESLKNNSIVELAQEKIAREGFTEILEGFSPALCFEDGTMFSSRSKVGLDDGGIQFQRLYYLLNCKKEADSLVAFFHFYSIATMCAETQFDPPTWLRRIVSEVTHYL